MKLGEPLPVREKTIAELQASPAARTWPFKFKGRVESYPVYQVSISFPKYRLNNGRTLAAQEEWLVTHPGAEKELFRRDQELETAQKAQHELLDDMVDEEGLLTYFKTNSQDEPLILSNRGFVINGNRRLAAFRRLYDQDKSKYKRFAQLDVIILPPATDKEIYELEVNLQVLPDLRAEYNWLREAKMMKRGREQMTYSDDELARIHQCKPKDVRDKIQLLEYADAYLNARGWDRQYHRIEKTEYAFKKLREGKGEMKRESDKLIFEEFSYILLDNPGGKGRLYEAIPDVKTHYNKILERIQKEVPVPSVTNSPGGDIALLDGPSDSSLALAKAVGDPANREKVMNAVVDVLQSERVKTQEFKTATFSLRRVQDAHTALVEALNNLSDGSNIDGLSNQLDSVESAIGKIRLWLKSNAEGSLPG